MNIFYWAFFLLVSGIDEFWLKDSRETDEVKAHTSLSILAILQFMNYWAVKNWIDKPVQSGVSYFIALLLYLLNWWLFMGGSRYKFILKYGRENARPGFLLS